MSMELITIIATIISVNIALSGLIIRLVITGQNSLRREMREQRDELQAHRKETQAEFKAVRAEIQAHREENQAEFKAVRAEIQAHREENQAEFKAMRAEMQAHREENQAEFKSTRAEAQAEFKSTRGETQTEFKTTREAIGELRERMAHLEGLMEGLREALTGRRVAEDRGEYGK